jgi:hypothetical protein
MLTLTCAKIILLRAPVLKRSIECGIVIAVIRSDELNAERTNIFLPRESLAFFQRYSGTATREISAITSAAGNQNLNTVGATEAQRGTH